MKTQWDKLPDTCFAILPSSGEVIGIKAGEMGYVAVTQPNGFTLEELNPGLTPQQVEAMVAGSMFGWHVPGADPELPAYKDLTWADLEKNRRKGGTS